MTADEAREILKQVRLFDGEVFPGVRWPAADAAVEWLAMHLREALATIILNEESPLPRIEDIAGGCHGTGG